MSQVSPRKSHFLPEAGEPRPARGAPLVLVLAVRLLLRHHGVLHRRDVAAAYTFIHFCEKSKGLKSGFHFIRSSSSRVCETSCFQKLYGVAWRVQGAAQDHIELQQEPPCLLLCWDKTRLDFVYVARCVYDRRGYKTAFDVCTAPPAAPRASPVSPAPARRRGPCPRAVAPQVVYVKGTTLKQVYFT